MSGNKVILAIESAIGGGSLSLVRNEDGLDTWSGAGDVSRAEDLLQNIDLILKQNDIDKAELTHIVVSVGPGSFTGIRIGLATAMGIASALNIELVKFSILHAMTADASPMKIGKNILTSVPVGRGVICTQRFRSSVNSILTIDEPTAIRAESFDIGELSQSNLVLTPESFPDGLASCLAAAVRDARIFHADKPLFIAKPGNI